MRHTALAARRSNLWFKSTYIRKNAEIADISIWGDAMNNIGLDVLPGQDGPHRSGRLDFEPLAPALGAVVHNLDLAAPLADAVIEAIGWMSIWCGFSITRR
jgi:hypothetical protein